MGNSRNANNDTIEAKTVLEQAIDYQNTFHQSAEELKPAIEHLTSETINLAGAIKERNQQLQDTKREVAQDIAQKNDKIEALQKRYEQQKAIQTDEAQMDALELGSQLAKLHTDALNLKREDAAYTALIDQGNAANKAIKQAKEKTETSYQKLQKEIKSAVEVIEKSSTRLEAISEQTKVMNEIQNPSLAQLDQLADLHDEKYALEKKQKANLAKAKHCTEQLTDLCQQTKTAADLTTNNRKLFETDVDKVDPKVLNNIENDAKTLGKTSLWRKAAAIALGTVVVAGLVIGIGAALAATKGAASVPLLAAMANGFSFTGAINSALSFFGLGFTGEAAATTTAVATAATVSGVSGTVAGAAAIKGRQMWQEADPNRALRNENQKLVDAAKTAQSYLQKRNDPPQTSQESPITASTGTEGKHESPNQKGSNGSNNNSNNNTNNGGGGGGGGGLRNHTDEAALNKKLDAMPKIDAHQPTNSSTKATERTLNQAPEIAAHRTADVNKYKLPDAPRGNVIKGGDTQPASKQQQEEMRQNTRPDQENFLKL